nr:uncharacterized protein LOC117692458 [Crassostrea gigas]
MPKTRKTDLSATRSQRGGRRRQKPERAGRASSRTAAEQVAQPPVQNQMVASHSPQPSTEPMMVAPSVTGAGPTDAIGSTQQESTEMAQVGHFQEPGTCSRRTTSANSGAIPDLALSSEIERLFSASMSVNTSEAYRVGIQAFEQFRIGQGLSLVWPPPDTHLNMFIAHLSIKHYKHSTAKSYIAAMSFKCKSHTLYDPTKNFVTQKLLQGMRRSTNTADTRLPITLDILQTIIPNLQFVCYSNYETSLYKAAFSLAFHALLRIGEIALSKGNSHETIIQCQDVSLLTNKLMVSIKRSKTDQCGRGVTLSVNASHGISFVHIGVNKVWVIGSSIVKRASIASRERKGGLNLGIVKTEIWWQGYGGMVLSQLLPKLRVLRRIENDPDVLIIHCGANSLGLIELKSLLEKLQDTLEQIAKLFPRSKLVWSNLLPRFNWRYSEDIRAMEDSRKRVNREAILLREKKMSKLWPLVTICVEVLPPSLMVFGPPIVAVAVP